MKKSNSTFPTRNAAAAGFYAIASFAILFVNKSVLTSYEFPSVLFLVICQYLFATVSLFLLKSFHVLSIPDMSWEIFRKVFPLSSIFLFNTIFGLYGTQLINVTMFTVLRRFSIVFTLILEQVLLNKSSSFLIKLSVFLMVGGAVIASFEDLSFDMVGYLFIMLNNITTAVNAVWIKMKMEKNKLSPFSLLYFNSIFSLPALIIIFIYFQELNKVINFDWEFSFFFYFFVSSGMGFLLNLSIFLCTHVNSPLTTTVIGCLKNVLTAYVGMFAVDYSFSPFNFMGVNVSILGSLVYSFVKYNENNS